MEKEKKTNFIIIIIIIIIIILSLIILKNNKKVQPEIQPINQTETDLNKAVTLDTTESITTNLNSISTEDTTDAELIPIDQELEKL